METTKRSGTKKSGTKKFLTSLALAGLLGACDGRAPVDTQAHALVASCDLAAADGFEVCRRDRWLCTQHAMRPDGSRRLPAVGSCVRAESRCRARALHEQRDCRTAAGDVDGAALTQCLHDCEVISSIAEAIWFEIGTSPGGAEANIGDVEICMAGCRP